MITGLCIVIAVLSFIVGFMVCHALERHEKHYATENEERQKEIDQQWDDLFKYNGKEV